MTYVPKPHNHEVELDLYSHGVNKFSLSLQGLINFLTQTYERVDWEFPILFPNTVTIYIKQGDLRLKVSYTIDLIEQGYSDSIIIQSILREIKEKFDVPNLQRRQ